jgi:hypothetical protein
LILKQEEIVYSKQPETKRFSVRFLYMLNVSH